MNQPITFSKNYLAQNQQIDLKMIRISLIEYNLAKSIDKGELCRKKLRIG